MSFEIDEPMNFNFNLSTISLETHKCYYNTNIINYYNMVMPSDNTTFIIHSDKNISFRHKLMPSINTTSIISDCSNFINVSPLVINKKLNDAFFSNSVFESCLFSFIDRINIPNIPLQVETLMPFIPNDKICLSGSVYLNMTQFNYSFTITMS